MKIKIVTLILLVGFSAYSQGHSKSKNGPSKHKMEKQNYTPEQRAELKTKELNLLLDLSEDQLTKISALELEVAKDRKTRFEAIDKTKDIDEEARFKHRTEMLDAKISHKNSMKSILTAEQYEKWEKSVSKKQKRKQHNARKGLQK